MFRALILSVLLLSPLPALAQPERQVPQSQAEIQLSYAPIVRAVSPAVVNVYATRVTMGRDTFFSDPFFEQFFGRSPLFQQRPQTSQSLGSGVIVRPDGLILTNNHVVEGATDIRVVLTDGHEYPVSLVLADSQTDLAVLRIEGQGADFPVVEFADSDRIEVGDIVLAIGNPFGVGQSVSSGIVSALARTGIGVTDYQFFIQTDAAINPGNSGGALVDMNGRLVGINTALFSRSGGSQGIGFAIPADMAQIIVAAAEAGGEITRPWFGARMQMLDTPLAQSLGLEVPRGALVTEIAPDSPAARAGIAPGDVITAIDGIAIQDPEAFNYRVATKPIGSTMELTLRRNGTEISATAELTAPPPLSDSEVTITGDTRFSGITAVALTPALAQRYGLGFSARGVAIISVTPGSPAQRLGLREGDVILSLNGTEITDTQAFETLASQRPRAWEIVLQRGGNVIRSYVSG